MTAGLVQTPHADLQRDADFPPHVVPHCIFAAGRQGFTALVRGANRPFDALVTIFLDLPLQEHGWSFNETHAWAIEDTADGTIFGFERKTLSSVLKTDGKNPGTGKSHAPMKAGAGALHPSDGA